MPSRNDDRSRRSSYDVERDRHRRSKHNKRDQERDVSPGPPSSERPGYRSFRRTNSSTGSSSSRPAYYLRRRSTGTSDTSRDRPKKKVYNVVDFGMDRRASTSHISGSRSNTTPYPSFSKAHSREAVLPHENISNTGRRSSSYNLAPTGSSSPTKSTPRTSPSASLTQRSVSNATKPTQRDPLSTSNPDIRRVQSRGSIRSENDYAKREVNGGGRNDDYLQPRESSPKFSASRPNLRDAEEGRSNVNTKTRTATASTPTATSPLRPTASSPMERTSSAKYPQNSRQSPSRNQPASGRSTLFQPTDSDATSIAPERKRGGQPPTLLSHRDTSPSSDPESFPRTPNGQDALSTVPDDRKETPDVEVLEPSNAEASFGEPLSNSSDQAAPPPPPPPPPMDVAPSDIPKVDYILRNGGLSRPISKKFISAPFPSSPVTYQQYSSPQVQMAKAPDANVAFAPYKAFLDDLDKVLSQKGSIAVATGYKSVSRRLVDRLESVFGRNISSQICTCVMCNTTRQSPSPGAVDIKVSWGEVLELVSGRKELPPWPPFSLPTASTGLGLSGLSQKPPMQKLDVDVPAEYREHYIRQSKKTKQAVDTWLAGQPEDQVNPPAEVDDETLIFAMLTYLEPADRRLFTALARGLSAVPDARSPTPALADPKTELMSQMGIALQRLYRLPKAPREPESSMYLLKHPDLHNALATLASISNHEWDIIVSGRFDGFLVSGAESQFQSMGAVHSRGPTPSFKASTPFRGGVASPASSFPPSAASPQISRQPPLRNAAGSAAPSPAPNQAQSYSGPAQLDEETEIAVLAEVEREIYTGMEALEDAFELLHVRAEIVRRALRERGAGLSMSARINNNGNNAAELDARLGTPFGGEGADRSFIGTPAGDLRTGSAWSHWSAVNSPDQRESRFSGNFGGESDDGLDDAASLGPDDSASNAGWRERSKHRYHRRRRPRRTPAPVDEGDE